MSADDGLAMTIHRPAELFQVRDEIRSLLAGTEVDVDAAVLVSSELVTNAIIHTAGPCYLRAWMITEQGALRVEVDDPLPNPIPTPSAGGSAPAGYGLTVVERVVSRWGVTIRAPFGKTVWFEIDP